MRERLGDAWITGTAKTMSFEVTVEGDVVMHTGANYSFTWGKDESAGQVLAIERHGGYAELHLLTPEGAFETLGPVGLEEFEDPKDV